MYFYGMEQRDTNPVGLSDCSSIRAQKPKNMASDSSSFCSVSIANDCGVSFNRSNLDRLSANDFIVETIFAMTGCKIGVRMIAQSLTESVCICGEKQSLYEWDDDGHHHQILVRE